MRRPSEPEPELLVPVQVEALVVNEQDRKATTWSVSTRTYSGADRLLPVEPPPFARGNDRPRVGVTVHWLLPDALTVTRWQVDDASGGTGALRAPHVPDRWLVVRTARDPRDPAPPAPTCRAWVVEGSHIGPDGTNPVPGLGYLGRATDLSRWTPPAKPEHALTALGPVDHTDAILHDLDPAYAGCVANVDNVFAFHDALDDLGPGDPAAVLSYAVIGWYADPDKSDPLRPQAILASHGSTSGVGDLDRVLAAMDWTADGREADQAIARGRSPSSTVLHGMVFGVRWEGRRGPAQPFTRGEDSPFAGRAIRSRARWRNPDPSDLTGFGDIGGPGQGPRASDAAGLRLPGSASSVGPGTRSLFPQVAVGSSTTDALAAMLEFLLGQEDVDGDTDHLATLFSALEHDLLDAYERPGGVGEVDRRLHQDGFAPRPGGHSYDVVLRRAQSAADPGSHAALAEGADLLTELDAASDPPGDLAKAVAELNVDQAALEDAEAALRAARRELYAVWWKARRDAGADDHGLGGQQGVVRLAVGARNKAAVDRDGQLVVVRDRLASTEVAAALRGVAGDGAGTLALEKVPRARFFAPADPVVLVSGVRASDKHGGDGRHRDDGRLLVRVHDPADPGRGTLRLRAGGVTIGPEQVVVPFFGGLLEGKPLPEATRALAAELVLLDAGTPGTPPGARGPGVDPPPDEGWRRWLADMIPPRVEPADLLAWQRGLWRGGPTGGDGFDGTRPSPVAVEAWARPWRPVYLAWRTTWYPSNDATNGDLDDWSFDGDEMQWNGLSAFDHAQAQTIQGRCLLSGTATRALRDAIDAVAQRLENAAVDPQESAEAEMARRDAMAGTRAALDRVRQALASADLVAQTLTGFHEQLVQRDPAQFHEADNATRKLLGDAERSAPMPFGDESGQRFQPLRAGHARLRRAWVVDAFGQVFDLIHEQGQSDASFVPLRGRGLSTAGLTQRSDTQMLQFPPRLVQPSRLVFRFLAGDRPVAGWLQTNHFDGSLMVSDPGGRLLGSLLLWRADGKGVRWEPAPGSGGESRPGAETTLGRIVAGLEGQDFAQFAQFLGVVDDTLATTDAAGERGGTTSVLVGRPLAVVDAELYVELDGPPLLDQGWRYTSGGSAATVADRTGGVTDLGFAVRLGLHRSRDDGVIGFYEDLAGSFGAAFHSVLPRREEAGHIVWSSPETWPRVPVRARGAAAVGPEAGSLRLTLLVDPRGSITACTGVQPSKSLRLPRHYIAGPLASLDASFRVGPVLGGATVRMPLPADIARGWSWIERTGVQLGERGRSETWSVPVGVDATPPGSPLADPPTRLREGWLQLSQVADRSRAADERSAP